MPPFDAAPTAINSHCLVCPIGNCLGRRAGGEAAVAWSGMLAQRMALMPGAGTLYRCGDLLHSMYSVRAGCIKTYTLDAQGNERIRGFYLPGDLVGLDAVGGATYLSSAAAVVPSQVCVVPVLELRRLMREKPELAQQLMERTSRELSLALAWSGDYTAEQRLAAFLLHMRERTGAGLGPLRLPMAQRDIGNYLRLATETVCRTLKAMERRGWIALHDRTVTFLNHARLCQAAEPVGIGSGPSEACLPRAA